jgi:hypothetical protein
MKNKYIRFLFMLVFLVYKENVCFSQQNGGMESWTPSGSPPPFDWLYPTGWTTNNATTEFITSGTKRSTDEHSGTYAAQLRTLNVFGSLTRSQLVLGTAMLDNPNYQVKAYTGGEPLSFVPTALSFYYKLDVDNVLEYAVAEVLIKRGTGTAVPDTVYHEKRMLSPVASYTNVEILIPNVGIDILTDSIVIAFASNDENEAGLNILYIDDVHIDEASALSPGPGAQTYSLYPNPVQQGIDVTVEVIGYQLGKLDILDVMGRKVNAEVSMSIDHHRATIHTSRCMPGVYLLMMDGEPAQNILLVQ